MSTVEYRVTWTIDVDASDPVEAAYRAQSAAQRYGTEATVFQVQQRDSHEAEWTFTDPMEVDLSATSWEYWFSEDGGTTFRQVGIVGTEVRAHIEAVPTQAPRYVRRFIPAR